MSPSPSHSAATSIDVRQMARLPQQSDGVGNALRQIFSGVPGLPSEFNALLGRLNNNDD